MKIYLAGRFSRRGEFASFVPELEALGHTITSSWLTRPSHPDFNPGLFNEAQPAQLQQQIAIQDLHDLQQSDCIIQFAESPRTSSRGGRLVEFGIALAGEIRVIVVGPGQRETVFHYLGDVEHFYRWENCLEHLTRERSE